MGCYDSDSLKRTEPIEEQMVRCQARYPSNESRWSLESVVIPHGFSALFFFEGRFMFMRRSAGMLRLSGVWRMFVIYQVQYRCPERPM